MTEAGIQASHVYSRHGKPAQCIEGGWFQGAARFRAWGKG